MPATHAWCLRQTPNTCQIPTHNHPTNTASPGLASVLVYFVKANMTDVDDVELIAAITFGLSYFYFKKKQNEMKLKRRKQRRWWMIKIHRNRTR
ncbi:unnamed protein product [Diatraea saccharalis]|uniref:Uncharacterized protein n=1 Tax=Diatraea saccharalis TaxID=40085 RepID=A0A9N9WIX7_9NEOP|nr:unnamed protein product [Diatraea saccharalis]